MRDTTRHPSVLVIDDHYAAEAPPDSPFYDRRLFLEDFGTLPFDFSFCSGWDESSGDYRLEGVQASLEQRVLTPEAVLLDIRFGDHETLGLDILSWLSARYVEVPVIILTSTPREDLLAECVNFGAVDYLVKPIQPVLLKQVLSRYTGANPEHWLIGHHDLFEAAVDQIARSSEGGTSAVLLLGDPGTGKELFARYLHRHGTRRAGPFQPVHIPGIPETLVDAELFGYCKGAFTGALRDEPGRLRRADGGVLFLDEVGDLNPVSQASLLRVLETQEVARLGDGQITRINMQVVAATNVNLAHRIKTNAFRLDLYSRLAGTVIRLPSLTERPSDIELLLRHLIRRACLQRKLAIPFFDIPAGVSEQVRRQPWPASVRDLWNYVQRVLDLSRGQRPTVANYRAALPVAESTGLLLNGQEPVASTESTMLRSLSRSTLQAAADFVERLTLEEFSLLNSALEATRDPLTGTPNRAKAAALLKNKARCSTNDFNRWVARLLDRLSPETARRLSEKYPELVTGLYSQSTSEVEG